MEDTNPIDRLEATSLEYKLTRLKAIGEEDGFDYGCEILGPSYRSRPDVARAVGYNLSDAIEGALSAYQIYFNLSQVAEECLKWVVQVVSGEFRNCLGCLVCFHGDTAECILLKPDGNSDRVITETFDNLLFFKFESVIAIPSGLTVFGQFPIDVRGVLASTSKVRGGKVNL